MVEVQYEVCAGLDVHQKTVVACVLTSSRKRTKPTKEIRTFGTRSCELRDLGDWLVSKQVNKVIMESTGQYWLPVWNVLEEFQLNMIVANPHRIKGIPGRKTDQKDSEWIADLGRYDLVAASYIPSNDLQDFRVLNRDRSNYVREITQHKNRVHNNLQRANIKLTSFISDIFIGSGRRVLNAFLDGEVITEELVAGLISKRCKNTPKDIALSMDGKMSKAVRVALVAHLATIDHLNAMIKTLDKEIEGYTSQYPELFKSLQTIPGVSDRCAITIMCEIGHDVSQFSSSRALASWAGLCPGSYESGGVRKSSHITHGNKYIRTVLFTAGMSAGNSNSPAFSDFYGRLKSRKPPKKAIVAAAHKILRIVYKMISEYTLTHSCEYKEVSNTGTC